MDCSPPGSLVHGIFQAWILGWVAISFSRGSSQPRDRTQVSHIVGIRFTIWATRELGYNYQNPEIHSGTIQKAYFNFTNFSINFFFSSRSYPGYHVVLSCNFSLVWKVLHYFVKSSSIWYAWSFLLSRLKLYTIANLIRWKFKFSAWKKHCKQNQKINLKQKKIICKT